MRVVFMGTPDFAVPPLMALLERHEVVLVVTQPDKPSGRGKRLAEPPVKLLAAAHGIPVIQPRSMRTPEIVETLRQSRADIAVVVAYGKILPRAVLEALPRGCINVHASLLPKYRGAAPIQWSIIRGETETGVTIMQLDEGMDTGPMLLRRTLAMEPGETAGSLFERLAPFGAEALLAAMDGLAAGTLVAEAQDHAAATYAPMLRKEDGVIDWAQTAHAVSARIRGVDPWPGAETTLDGVALKLFGATLIEPQATLGRAGEVVAVDGRGLVVACGQGACAISILQAPGRRAMPAKAFVSGRPIARGTVLGAASPTNDGNVAPAD